MSNPARVFDRVFLVYCLERLADGSYIALNKRYCPIGTDSSERVEYETSPARFKFKRALTAAQISALSFDGDARAQRIYLYNDGCVPTASDAHWRAYSERLQRLAGYTLVI